MVLQQQHSELNIMDGVTATTAELNYSDDVTSNIQTQLDAKATKGFGYGDCLVNRENIMAQDFERGRCKR